MRFSFVSELVGEQQIGVHMSQLRRRIDQPQTKPIRSGLSIGRPRKGQRANSLTGLDDACIDQGADIHGVGFSAGHQAVWTHLHRRRCRVWPWNKPSQSHRHLPAFIESDQADLGCQAQSCDLVPHFCRAARCAFSYSHCHGKLRCCVRRGLGCLKLHQQRLLHRNQPERSDDGQCPVANVRRHCSLLVFCRATTCRHQAKRNYQDGRTLHR